MSHLVLDSTGLSIVWAGAWAAAKHGPARIRLRAAVRRQSCRKQVGPPAA